MGRPWGDVAGANPHTGPIVFSGPAAWHEQRAAYGLRVTRWIDDKTANDGPPWEELLELDTVAPLTPEGP
jgi:hypothetical protein